MLDNPVHVDEIEGTVAEWQSFSGATDPMRNVLIEFNRVIGIETDNSFDLVIEVEFTAAGPGTEIQDHHLGTEMGSDQSAELARSIDPGRDRSIVPLI